VARKTPIPERELQICARLRETRLGRKLSRVSFCELIHIDSSKYASYELGRVPLPFWTGNTFCECTGTSQRWLATGIGPQEPCLPVSKFIFETVGPRALFSEVYDRWLSLDADRLHVELEKSGRVTRSTPAQLILDRAKDLAGLGASKTDWDIAELGSGLLANFERLSPQRRKLFAQELLSVIERYGSKSVPKELVERDSSQIATPETGGVYGKIAVDTNTASVSLHTVSGIPKTWAELADRVRRATAAPGAKAQLARDMGVSRQAVNKWLRKTDSGAPSADLIFRLLAWVTAEEAKQQQSAASGSTPTAPKTRMNKGQVNEPKNKSSPTKR
jgi:transcriptional regulator with XRE-family HTH domain